MRHSPEKRGSWPKTIQSHSAEAQAGLVPRGSAGPSGTACLPGLGPRLAG